jgi:hypothetical protein
MKLTEKQLKKQLDEVEINFSQTSNLPAAIYEETRVVKNFLLALSRLEVGANDVGTLSNLLLSRIRYNPHLK